MKKLAVFVAILAISGCAGMQSKPDYQTAITEAEAAVKKAASAGGEWRDSGKFIKEAKKLAAEGKMDKAVDLALKAKKQGELGYQQAMAQKDAGPWLF